MHQYQPFKHKNVNRRPPPCRYPFVTILKSRTADVTPSRADGTPAFNKPEKNAVHRTLPLVAAFLAATVASQAADRPTRFWNLTHATVQEFQLAPAGTTAWGPDQCKNDKDGAVDFDERLAVTGVESGRYDARLKDASGRVCFARNIAIEAGKVFSIDEKALVDCTK
jgi:hypothetical protein